MKTLRHIGDMSKLTEEDYIDFSRGSEITECFHWKKLTFLTAGPGNILKQHAADGKDYTYFQTLWELHMRYDHRLDHSLR